MVEYIGDGNPDGTVLGQSSSELIAFHGATPTDQYAAITSVSTSAPTSSSPFGFVTTAQLTALVTAVNSIIAALKEKGITA